jgi:hypothetical protein
MATSMEEHVETFLGEFRMVVPALAALFGFQLTAAFSQSYDSLPAVDKAVNFAGVCCSALGFLFLLVPASYHRFIGEHENTREFLQFARRCIMLAFAFVPLGISLALYLQAKRSLGSEGAALATGVLAMVAFASAWWLVPALRARARGKQPLKTR